MTVKIIYCLYQDSTRDIWSNIPLRLQKFPRASPLGTPSDKGVYLTVFPSSRPNTDTVYTILHYNVDNVSVIMKVELQYFTQQSTYLNTMEENNFIFKDKYRKPQSQNSILFSLNRPHWVDSALQLPCPSVCYIRCSFSKHRPSGPMLSIS